MCLYKIKLNFCVLNKVTIPKYYDFFKQYANYVKLRRETIFNNGRRVASDRLYFDITNLN